MVAWDRLLWVVVGLCIDMGVTMFTVKQFGFQHRMFKPGLVSLLVLLDPANLRGVLGERYSYLRIERYHFIESSRCKVLRAATQQ